MVSDAATVTPFASQAAQAHALSKTPFAPPVVVQAVPGVQLPESLPESLPPSTSPLEELLELELELAPLLEELLLDAPLVLLLELLLLLEALPASKGGIEASSSPQAVTQTAPQNSAMNAAWPPSRFIPSMFALPSLSRRVTRSASWFKSAAPTGLRAAAGYSQEELRGSRESSLMTNSEIPLRRLTLRVARSNPSSARTAPSPRRET